MTLDSAPSGNASHDDHAPALSDVQRECVRRALGEVLTSAPMRSTLQCQTLLRYITEHTLSGESALLRERVIGKEVFGRRPDYEPGEDPVVRIRAADLRKRLALYYQSLHKAPEVRIEVPSGSYKATFTWITSEPESESLAIHPLVQETPNGRSQEPPPLETPFLPQSTALPAGGRSGDLPSPLDNPLPSNRTWPWMAVVALILIVSVMGFNWYHDRFDRDLRTFWNPLLESSKPILISIGSNAVYRVSDQKADQYSKQNHVESSGMEFFLPFTPDQTFASTGLYPADSSFVALGDVASVSETVAMLTNFTKPFQERFPNDISFAEVRNNPTILIGGFNNPMARELTRNFRFVLSARNRIEDRTQPGKAWILHASTDSHDTEDYAIVTRVLRHDEDEPWVSVAGMGQYGTLAATDFVCKAQGIRQLAASIGKDWPRRNFQIVLRIKIRDFNPVSTDIVATHTW